MFDTLTQRMTRIIKTLRGEARLTEANMQQMLREVRLALLEADVALPVVRAFIERVKEKALGTEVANSLTPGQTLVSIVQRELIAMMGGSDARQEAELQLAVKPPAIILMAGLQGAGKTTTVGKLAKLLHEQQKKKVLTVSVDVYRPAAIAQLKTVTEQAGADFFPSHTDQSPVEIARAARDWARRHYHDVLLVDTAGRLSIDERMMAEISALHVTLQPAETLFVVDAMLGQDAVNTAKAFNDALPLTGVALTKLDGDARGGAALSVRYITGKPIKFIGVSEKLDGLHVFYPERIVNRILGQGDLLTLAEQAQRGIDDVQADQLIHKIKKGGRFDLNDFQAQLIQMNKMGGMAALLDNLPVQFQPVSGQSHLNQAEKQMRRMTGIIHSMTVLERAQPELIKARRKRRIATGAGVQVQEVNRLLTQFEQMRTMMKKLKGGKLARMMPGFRGSLPR